MISLIYQQERLRESGFILCLQSPGVVAQMMVSRLVHGQLLKGFYLSSGPNTGRVYERVQCPVAKTVDKEGSGPVTKGGDKEDALAASCLWPRQMYYGVRSKIKVQD